MNNEAFLITSPHSGEEIPDEVTWLKGLAQPTLMRDVDRFVDQLYAPVVQDLKLNFIKAKWHRYFADLNRTPEDIDQDSVIGAAKPAGSHTTGFHWIKTTWGETLMPKPITKELHELIVKKYFQPFHNEIKKYYELFKSQGAQRIFHLDAHSMPSKGTDAHRDSGEERAEIVISDQDGQSCMSNYKDLVIEAYTKAGFQTAYNWPYKGGKLTQTYGQPGIGQHTIQVEINRKLYMDENTKKCLAKETALVQQKIKTAVSYIYDRLEKL